MSKGKWQMLNVKRGASPHDAFAEEDRLGEAGGHHFVSVDQGEEEAEVLLGAAQVVAQGRAPLLSVRLESVLKVFLLDRLLRGVGGEDGGPAGGIQVLGAG